MNDRPDEPLTVEEIVERIAWRHCASENNVWDELPSDWHERYRTEAAQRLVSIQSALLLDISRPAIDQARREGYAAGVRAAAEKVETLGVCQELDVLIWNGGPGFSKHTLSLAAQIRALDGKGNGV